MRNLAILFFCLFIMAPQLKAQEAPSEKCLVNISLFNESAKNKQYADAVTPWKEAYAECPGANRAIYTRGREIVRWMLSQSKDEKTYDENFKLLMEMYDNRIKYFGNDKRFPKNWILGLKALDYITFVKGDAEKKQAYEWLEESVNGMKDKSEIEVLKQLVLLSEQTYKKTPSHAPKFISDYLEVSSILDRKSKNPAEKKAGLALQVKQVLDLVFVQSGAADCATLNNIYKAEVEKNKTNLEYLNEVLSFYRKVGCTEEEVYFTAATAAHKIKPSAESANACAQMAYKKKDYTKAIEYYEEATRLEDTNLEKAEQQYKIAQILYSELKNPVRARQAARKSLEFNPKSGKSYLLIGLLYANTQNLYKDPVLDKTVYWVAVDKFIKAKQVDDAVTADANRLISTYSAYFPSKDDLFFKQELAEGQPFTVEGWINETTTARALKQ